MTKEEVIKQVFTKYSRYGIDRDYIEKEIANGEEKGLGYADISVALRMALSNLYDTEELFTTKEVSEATGVPEEEIIKDIERARKEAEEKGLNPDEVAYKTTGDKSTYFISSLF